MLTKTINILGVTGSVGQCAADVIASDPSRFDVHCVTANQDVQKLAQTAQRLNAKRAIIAQPEKYNELRKALEGTGIIASADTAEATSEKVDVTLAAIVGMAGLRPLMQAIQNSKCVAIANKEPLVAAGTLVINEAKKHGTTILPVDSEHNAIFQVFDFDRPEGIEKIILTASGGPFRTWTSEQMASATLAQALAHPNWVMGKKISIDSATMMNKALEIIEAHYLFSLPSEKIEVMVHPQSIVHSMVEYKDGSVLAQMGASDMRTPIAHALAWPERMKSPGQRLNLSALKHLDFELPDFDRFPALKMAYEALNSGPAACISLNAANEVAVASFLAGECSFHGILGLLRRIMDECSTPSLHSLEDIELFNETVQQSARTYIKGSGTTQTAITA